MPGWRFPVNHAIVVGIHGVKSSLRQRWCDGGARQEVQLCTWVEASESSCSALCLGEDAFSDGKMQGKKSDECFGAQAQQ